tara:strand:- start:246 stop:899 length:654 start_codon:yes stop_codon:yes gene_type:complete
MDLLDKYKKTWGLQPKNIDKISSEEIYKMARSKSISIVKWIFILGLIEFSIGIIFMLLSIYQNQTYDMLATDLLTRKYLLYLSFLTVPFLLYFLNMFYNNYKNISVTDNTRVLMEMIKKTRRSVRNYILFNLAVIVLGSIIITFISLKNSTRDIILQNQIINFQLNFDDDESIIIIMVIITVITLTLIWSFYQLIYGNLLKKINRNYRELKKIDNDL